MWQGEYDPFGNPLRINNPKRIYQPIRMQGQHYDDESGLHYNRHRYYDAYSGRYITQDPIGLMGGINIYNYPLNPVGWIDPLGLQACFKKRALDGFPWLGIGSSNPVDDYFNTEISHEQLFFSDGTNMGYFNHKPDWYKINGQGKVKSDETRNIPNYKDSTEECFEDDELMLKALKSVNKYFPMRYRLFGNNCQTWAEAVKDKYNELKK